MIAKVLVLCITFLSFATSKHVPLRDEYLKYLRKHEKPLDRLDDTHRLEAFKNTKEFIAQHAAGSRSYHVGLNEMADRLPHELPGSDTSSAGVTPSTNNEQTSEYVLKISRLKEKQKITNVKRFLYWHEKMPTMDKEYMVNLNWGSENNPYNVSIVGAVGNQGLCGACWSFVATAATEALVYMSSGMHLRLSEQELIDCDRGFNKGCEGGNPVYAFDYILNWGLTNQANYPYRENGHSRCRRDQYTSKAAIQGYLRLPSGNQAIIKNFVRMSQLLPGYVALIRTFFITPGDYLIPLIAA